MAPVLLGQNPPLESEGEGCQLCALSCGTEGQRAACSFRSGNLWKKFRSLLLMPDADSSYLCQYRLLWVKCRYQGIESTVTYIQINTFSSLFHTVTCGQLQRGFLWALVLFLSEGKQSVRLPACSFTAHLFQSALLMKRHFTEHSLSICHAVRIMLWEILN